MAASSEHTVAEEDGRAVACAGLWDRGAHIRERWTNRETDEEHTTDRTALLDFGFAGGHEDAMARLIQHLVARTGELGRTYLMAPLQYLPTVTERLEHLEPDSIAAHSSGTPNTPKLMLASSARTPILRTGSAGRGCGSRRLTFVSCQRWATRRP